MVLSSLSMMMCSTPPQFFPVARSCRHWRTERRAAGDPPLSSPLSSPPLLSRPRGDSFLSLFPLFASQMPVTRPTGLQVPTVYQPFVTFLEKPNTKLIFLGHLIFAGVGNAEVFPTDDLVICIWRLLCFGPINCTFPPCF